MEQDLPQSTFVIKYDTVDHVLSVCMPTVNGISLLNPARKIDNFL